MELTLGRHRINDHLEYELRLDGRPLSAYWGEPHTIPKYWPTIALIQLQLYRCQMDAAMTYQFYKEHPQKLPENVILA